VPEHPCEPALAGFPGECRRRNKDHRAVGAGCAVAAHLARDHPRQRATTASTHDQHVTRAAGNADEDPAGRASLYVRLHLRIVRDLSPDRDERIPEPLAGHVLPDLAQIARGLRPGGVITLRRHPRNDRHKGRIMGAGQNLRVAQCPQAARGATRPDDYAIYARHGGRPSPRLAVAGNSDDQDPGWHGRVGRDGGSAADDVSAVMARLRVWCPSFVDQRRPGFPAHLKMMLIRRPATANPPRPQVSDQHSRPRWTSRVCSCSRAAPQAPATSRAPSSSPPPPPAVTSRGSATLP
jgi:hypothetical protein